MRSVESQETTTPHRIKHGIPADVAVCARVATLLASCAAASLAAVACALLTLRVIEVHIHDGPWPRG